MRFIESSQFYLSTDQDSNACEDFFPWRARINENPTNTHKTNEPGNTPTNPDFPKRVCKPHKQKKPVPGASEIGLICFSTEKLDKVSYEMYDLYNNVKGA